MLEKRSLIPPPAEIIERAKSPLRKLKGKIVSPDVLQTILLDELAGRLEDITEIVAKMANLTSLMQSQMEKIPEGMMFPIPALAVSGLGITSYNLEEEPDAGSRPWFSASISNDGPDDIEFRANSYLGRWQLIQEGEAVNLDFHAAKLRRLYFKGTSASSSASVRILGEA